MKSPSNVLHVTALSPEASITSDVGQLAITIRRAATFLTSLIDPDDKNGKRHLYNMRHLQNLTGGGDKNGKGGIKGERLHKNSILKIRDLRKTWAVAQPIDPALGKAYRKAVTAAKKLEEPLGKKEREAAGLPVLKKPKMHWVAAEEGTHGFMGLKSHGRYQWLWNPQVDSFEKLERILVEARKYGFDSEALPVQEAA